MHKGCTYIMHLWKWHQIVEIILLHKGLQDLSEAPEDLIEALEDPKIKFRKIQKWSSWNFSEMCMCKPRIFCKKPSTWCDALKWLPICTTAALLQPKALLGIEWACKSAPPTYLIRWEVKQCLVCSIEELWHWPDPVGREFSCTRPN